MSTFQRYMESNRKTCKTSCTQYKPAWLAVGIGVGGSVNCGPTPPVKIDTMQTTCTAMQPKSTAMRQFTSGSSTAWSDNDV
eukprot:CAMPEP_0172801500 /NCGR_PEP_ID=MMETSP1075-20121228/3239_1 /TAXON_ID=2916 /ORGANISM="Ceratium fusus, Strain PA161109" /LENGTH=80 /DNA_ID=CAMNT_0013639569 /DNA_START=132 /DNA_END=374 /DNA_ORIENTATION=+